MDSAQKPELSFYFIHFASRVLPKNHIYVKFKQSIRQN